MKYLAPHCPEWKNLFTVEERGLSEQLGEDLVAAHHIGSTAVAGLPAKPIIDILFEVASLSRLDSRQNIFISRGYEPRGEYGIAGRRYFSKKPVGKTPGYHIHAYEVGDGQIKRHLAFRDYLRLKSDVAMEYANIKRSLSDDKGILAVNYQEAKKRWVDTISLEAVRYFSTVD